MKTKFVILLPLLAVAAAQAAPAAWKPVLSRKGECQTMVPSAWVPGFAGLGMKAAAGKSDVLVSYKASTVAAIKAMLPSVFKITKT